MWAAPCLSSLTAGHNRGSSVVTKPEVQFAKPCEHANMRATEWLAIGGTVAVTGFMLVLNVPLLPWMHNQYPSMRHVRSYGAENS